MCDCIKTVKQAVIDKVSSNEHNPKCYKLEEVSWEHVTIFPKSRLYTNIMLRSTFEKKDGSTSKPRNEHVPIFFTYCPFCGEKLSEK